jgi:hypothetical protein
MSDLDIKYFISGRGCRIRRPVEVGDNESISNKFGIKIWGCVYLRSITTGLIPTCRPSCHSPSPQWEGLQLQYYRPDVKVECHGADEHTNNVGHVITIPLDHALTTAVGTSVSLSLESAGKRRRHEISFQGVECRRRRGRNASRRGEQIDEFENEEFRERASKVGYPVHRLVCTLIHRRFEIRTSLTRSYKFLQWPDPLSERGKQTPPQT